jgi:hypothetical protein
MNARHHFKEVDCGGVEQESQGRDYFVSFVAFYFIGFGIASEF